MPQHSSARPFLLATLLSALLLASGPASAAGLKEDYEGFYTGTDSATGQELLARLELLEISNRPSTLLVTVFDPARGYRVYAGSIYRGGLYIPIGSVFEAKDANAAYQALRTPRLVFRPGDRDVIPNPDLFTSESRCELQFDFVQPGRMTYGCEDRRNGSHSSGVLLRRRV
jgi:hypothetical protein